MTTITLDIPEELLHSSNITAEQLPLILELGISRFAPLSTQAYREVLTLLTQATTPEEIVAFRFSEEIEQRMANLLEKNREDQLTQAEQVELERLSQLEEQLQLVKANALLQLTQA